MLKQLCWDVSHVPQESHWAELQDRAARKATELKSLNMAIHSLFQAASTRLQPKGKVAAGDSHRQLDMVKAEHSPAPCPGKAAGMVLPKRGDSLQAQQSLLSLLGSLGMGNGGDTWEICPFPEGGAESGALWGWKDWEPGRDRDVGMQIQPWPRLGFIPPQRPVLVLQIQQGPIVLSLSLGTSALQERQAPLCLLFPVLP